MSHTKLFLHRQGQPSPKTKAFLTHLCEACCLACWRSRPEALWVFSNVFYGSCVLRWGVQAAECCVSVAQRAVGYSRTLGWARSLRRNVSLASDATARSSTSPADGELAPHSKSAGSCQGSLSKATRWRIPSSLVQTDQTTPESSPTFGGAAQRVEEASNRLLPAETASVAAGCRPQRLPAPTGG